jgi:hypothetical protein
LLDLYAAARGGFIIIYVAQNIPVMWLKVYSRHTNITNSWPWKTMGLRKAERIIRKG